MSRFSFSYCPKCRRLNIHGATCTCGQRTDQPTCSCPTDAEIRAAIHHSHQQLTGGNK